MIIKQILIFCSILGIFLLPFKGFGQKTYSEIESVLVELAKADNALNSKIDNSLSGVPLNDMIRAIATSNGVNVNVDPSLTYEVSNSFTNAKVIDVFLFLIKKYDLDIEITGNIISFNKKNKITEIKPYNINITFDNNTGNISFDLKRDTLASVCKRMTQLTGKNFVISTGLENYQVNGYILDKPFENAIQQFAYANELEIAKTSDDFYVVKKKQAEQKEKTATVADQRTKRTGTAFKQDEGGGAFMDIKKAGIDRITVDAEKVSIGEIIKEVSLELNKNYLIAPEIKETSSVHVNNITYSEFLELILKGTDYFYISDKDVFLIGKGEETDLQTTKLKKMEFRTVDSISTIIPNAVKEGVDIIEFDELNSILLSGSPSDINKVSAFLDEIDVVVPLVLIEVMIIDVNKSSSIETGISAGRGKNPGDTLSKILPGVDIKFSTKAINDMLNKFNGFGLVNIGQVTPQFYFNIKALEEKGDIKIRSTPKLSTLNGHKAELESGETKYYKEQRNDYYGSQNPSLSQSYQWKETQAKLKISIRPNVSGDEQITLEIVVTQEEFTAERVSLEAPPGKANRTFKSLIRVKNEELVLLGGIERNSLSKSSSGIPVLSRIPVLKWIFSTRTKQESDSKLSVFIKPTVIY